MTLTELSYKTRKLLPVILIVFLILMILFYSVKLLFLYISRTRGPVPVYTDTKFGKIKAPVIDGSTGSSGITFILDTIEGQPITATAAAGVYLLPPVAPQLNYREKIYLIARALGFNTETVKHTLSGRTAVFNDEKQSVNIDVANFNFDYQYGYDKDPLIFLDTRVPPQPDIEEKARDFLKSVGRYPEELAKGKLNIVYHNYNVKTNTLYVTKNPSEANVVEVDFYRPDVGEFPVVSPKYFTSENYVIMVFKESTFKVIRAQMRFLEKSEDQVGSYPIKSGDTAFNDLKTGKGFIVSGPKKSTITIRKMFMGYYDASTNQNYLQPVYVFLGDENFVAYVPAIETAWLED